MINLNIFSRYKTELDVTNRFSYSIKRKEGRILKYAAGHSNEAWLTSYDAIFYDLNIILKSANKAQKLVFDCNQ